MYISKDLRYRLDACREIIDFLKDEVNDRCTVH